MNLLFTFDLQNYDLGWPMEYREAVRAIIEKDGKLVLVRSEKYGDVKFPGGGMEEGEILFDTLIREVREETGLTIISGSIRNFGKTLEIRKSYNADTIFHHTSYYCFCQAEEGAGTLDLDEYEKDYGYAPILLTAREAYAHNRGIPMVEQIPWLQRETAIMKLLCDEKYAPEE